VDDATYAAFCRKRDAITAAFNWLNNAQVKPNDTINQRLEAAGQAPLKQMVSMASLLRRPELSLADLGPLTGQEILVDPQIALEVQLQVKYEGYIRRQQEQVERFKKLENINLPEEMNYTGLPGLSHEVVEKLNRIQPRSLGQASRISGITPAAISVLQVHLKKEGLL